MDYDVLEAYFYRSVQKRHRWWWNVKHLAKILKLTSDELITQLSPMMESGVVVITKNHLVAVSAIKSVYGKTIKRLDNRFQLFLYGWNCLKRTCEELALFVMNYFRVPTGIEPTHAECEQKKGVTPIQEVTPHKAENNVALNLSYFSEEMLRKKRAQVKKWTHGRKKNWQSEDDLTMQFIVRDLSITALLNAWDRMTQAGDLITRERFAEIIKSKRSANDYSRFAKAANAKRATLKNNQSQDQRTTSTQKSNLSDEEIIRTAKFLLSDCKPGEGIPSSWAWLYNEMIIAGHIVGNYIEEHYPRPQDLYEALGDIMNPLSERIIV